MADYKDDDDYFLYLLSEMYYKKQCIKLGYDENDIFPPDWYGINNYRRKAFIIMEAVHDNKLISETEMLYKIHLDPIEVMAKDLAKEHESGKWDEIYLNKNGLIGRKDDNTPAIDPFCCLRISQPDSPEEMIRLANAIVEKTNDDGKGHFSVRTVTNDDGDTVCYFDKE